MSRDWAAFDRADLQSAVGQRRGNGLDVMIALDGMHCANCAARAERALGTDTQDVRINVAARTLAFHWRPGDVQLSALLKRLDDAGLAPQLLARSDADTAAVREERVAKARIGVAIVCAMQVMMLAWPQYTGAVPDAGIAYLLRLAQWVIATPAVIWAGAPFFINAYRALRQRQLDMDVPIALALAAAYLPSAWRSYTGSGEIYFDTATMFVALLALGRWLEQRTRRLAGKRVRQLAGRRALTAQRRVNGIVESVPITALQAGDELLVAAGDALPADGLLLETEADLDEALLTGESRPVHHSVGDTLLAGSLNVGAAPLILRAEKVGTATVLAQITRLLDAAQTQKPRAQRVTDRIARHFITAVLGLAVFGIALTLLRGKSGDAALDVALAVLVASCPCALSLAVPAALAAATSRLSARGVLVSNAEALLALPKVDTVVFDKTGTLTENALQLSLIEPLGSRDAASCLQLAAALEQGQRHPIAKALLRSAPNAPSDVIAAAENGGLHAFFGGRQYWLGAPEHVPVQLPPPAGANIGETAIVLTENGKPLARFFFTATLRPEAPEIIAELQAQPLEVEILSGDSADATRALARQIGVKTYAARQTPVEKLARLQALQQQGRRVLAVGDGMNDAPLLAAADVSAALPDGSALAQARADLLLLGNSLTGLPLAIAAAKTAARRIHENLLWAAVYNIAVLPLALAGLLQPSLAAAGMSISSLLVVLNALRPGAAERAFVTGVSV